MAAFRRLSSSARAAAAAARLAYSTSSPWYPTAAASRRAYSFAISGRCRATPSSASAFAADARRAAAYGTNVAAGRRAAAAYATNAAGETGRVLDVPIREDIHPAASPDEEIGSLCSTTPILDSTDKTGEGSDNTLQTSASSCSKCHIPGCINTSQTLNSPCQKILTLDEYYEEEGLSSTFCDLDEFDFKDEEGEGDMYRMFGMGSSEEIGNDGLPIRVDWRRKGAVAPVRDQGKYCNSCWAFATVGAIEGINFKKTNKLIKLSEQQFVDGSNVNNDGCDGGNLVEAFEYAIKMGVVPAKDYPYVGKQQNFRNVYAPIITISDYKSSLSVSGDERKGLNSLIILGAWSLWKHRNECVFNGATPSLSTALTLAREEALVWSMAGARGLPWRTGSPAYSRKKKYKLFSGEAELKKAVAHQPVATCINADDTFISYKKGVLYGPSSGWKELNHAVLVVGYDITPQGQEYWIVKNSRGRFFGRLGGYVHLARGVFPKGGTLGIARLCVIPIKGGPNKFGKVLSEKQMGVQRKVRKSWP